MSIYVDLYLKFNNANQAKGVMTGLTHGNGKKPFKPDNGKFSNDDFPIGINTDLQEQIGDGSYYVMLSCLQDVADLVPGNFKVTRPSGAPVWFRAVSE